MSHLCPVFSAFLGHLLNREHSRLHCALPPATSPERAAFLRGARLDGPPNHASAMNATVRPASIIFFAVKHTLITDTNKHQLAMQTGATSAVQLHAEATASANFPLYSRSNPPIHIGQRDHTGTS
jgi:hypothetical protein